MHQFYRDKIWHYKTTQWGSYNGKKYRLDEMSHQHLSNAYYYVKLLDHPLKDDLCYTIAIMEVFMEKWNGKILPYKPHPLFTYETSMLREFNMIVFMNKKQIIIDPYNGKQIGEIVDGEFIEDEKKASE